jgi:hypothetical protein
MSIETVCCENMSITCFAFCLEMWNVIWQCDSDCFLQRLFEMIRSRDHAWSSHRQFFFDRLVSFFNEWRMLILDYRVTYVCSRSVERRLWWNVKLDEAFYQTWSETTHQTWRKRLIKLDESDSSSLTKATHQSWRKRFIRLDERNVISSNLTKASFHQTWRKRHLIKLDENVISSNFWEERQFFYFLMNNSAATLDVKNLILQKIIFCVKIAVISERSWWKLNADITQFFLIKKEFQVMSKQWVIVVVQTIRTHNLSKV